MPIVPTLDLTLEEKQAMLRTAVKNLWQQRYQIEMEKLVNPGSGPVARNCDERIAKIDVGITELMKKLGPA